MAVPTFRLLLALLAAAVALEPSGVAAADTSAGCKAKHCAQCAPRGGGRTCKLCHVGFYADKRGVCRTCSSAKCADCTTTGACNICEPGYGTKRGRCHRCNLANCSSCNGSPNTCQLCASGYGLVKKGGKRTCAKCAQNDCLQCNGSPTKCTACKAHLEAVNGTCVVPNSDNPAPLGKNIGALEGSYLYMGAVFYTQLTVKINLPWDKKASCKLNAKMGSLGAGTQIGLAYLNLAEGWDAARFCHTFMRRGGFGFGGGHALVVGGYAPSTGYGGTGVWDVLTVGVTPNFGSYGTASWDGCTCP